MAKKFVEPPFDPRGPGEWTGVEPVAAWLGVDHQMIRSAIRTKKLAAYQPGGKGSRIRLHRDDVLAWVERGRTKPRGPYVAKREAAKRLAGPRPGAPR